MKCSLCHQETERFVPIELMTGKQLGVTTSGRTTTKVYGAFQPFQLAFCETCWRVFMAREEHQSLGNGILMLVFAPLIALFLSLVLKGGLRIAVWAAMGLLFLYGLVTALSGLAKRRRPTDWSAQHFDEKAPPNRYFPLFNAILPNLVYGFRGKEIYYWKRSEWEAWQKAQVRSNVESYISADPTLNKDANQDRLRASILKDVAAGKLETALARCDDYFLSGILQNLEGTLLEQAGRVEEARVHYCLALLQHPGLAEAEQNLARLGEGG
jgi:hypothetical protein